MKCKSSRALTGALSVAVLLPLAAPVAHAQVPSTQPSGPTLWTLPEFRAPVRPLGSPSLPPVPLVRLGRALIPLARLGFGLNVPPLPSVSQELGDPAPLSWSRDRLFRIGTLGPAIAAADIPARAPSAGRLMAAQSRYRTEFADLAFTVRGTGQLGGDWARFRPCDETVQVTCEVSLTPRLTPDVRFTTLVEGTVADRVAIDVDYDQTREFQGTNRVNVQYRGRPGEVLQSLDIGDIRFGLPASRFLTQGVPVGNFGFQAVMEAGPVQLRSLWAQQSGEVNSRSFRLEGSGSRFSRTDTLVLDDADYATGQFFFLVDPSTLRDSPHVDALGLVPSDAPPGSAPGAQPIQLYRSEIDLYARQQVEGLIQADAFASLGRDTVSESAWFRLMSPGQDYMMHSSGLWIALRSPLAPGEILAVTYVTEGGDTIGTYNPETAFRRGRRARLQLLKASSAQHQPGRPTWAMEMHQVYRVSSAGDIDPASVDLVVSLGEKSAGRTFARRANGDDVTYLRLFGLDEESPRDRLDQSQIYRPALDSFEDQPPVSGTFVFFSTLEPFARPPPLRRPAIDSAEVVSILGPNRNERIYRDPDPFERDNGGVFRLNISYRTTPGAATSSFRLGAVGIRPATERVTLGATILLRDRDYLMDYDLGQLTLLNPEGLLASNPGQVLSVSWEQRSLFQVAPSSVFGVNARYRLGDYGAFNLVGLYQSEDEVLRRPQLGAEAASVGLVGVDGEVHVDAPAVTRLLQALPGLRSEGPTSLRLSGEAAISLPNPNRQGVVYLDDFDAQSARGLSLRSHHWRLGSRPAYRAGAEGVLPGSLTADAHARMTWQHTWMVEGPGGDSLGAFQGFSPATDIDRQIRIAGTAVREPGLFVRFEPGSGDREGPRAFSSITTVLSPTGTDLTRSDFIEFYVRDGDFLSLVLDVGVVSEDAFFVDSTGAVSGIRPRVSTPWGLGVLDQEADPRRGDVWGREADERGVWNEACVAERGRVYRRGDVNANCTRGNGRPDSEDLDGDGNLDELERYRRFVVSLDGSSPFLIRDRHETGTSFRLYRIPLRGQAGVDVGGAVTDAQLRAVRHLRITVAGKRRDSFVLARLGIVGSNWIKRTPAGVLRGLGGDTASLHGRAEVGSVSRVIAGEAYASPPGVIEQLDDPIAAFAGQGVEFNERSLSIGFEDVLPGDRVEVYHRFPQRPRDFLSYREGRLWVVAPRADFGGQDAVYFFVKVATDDRNFYLYRAKPNLSAAPGRVLQEEWAPEVVIRFEEWLTLRSVAEQQLVDQARLPGDPPLVLWSADSSHAVVLQDRGRAPNLASVREVSLGIINEGAAAVSGELWVDELRLARGIRDAGMSTVLNAEIEGDVLRSSVSFRNRGGYYRPLQSPPTFQNDQAVDVRSTIELARFAPQRWGLEAPVSLTYQRDAQAPIFLGHSDVRAEHLEGLRTPQFSRTRVDVSLRRAVPRQGGILDDLINGLNVRAGVVRSSLQSITTRSREGGVDALAAYRVDPSRRDVPLFPGRAQSLVRALLPRFLENRVAAARIRYTPERVAVEGEWLARDLSTSRFDHIVRRSGDSLIAPARAPRRHLRATAHIALRPVESLAASAEWTSGRDLLAVAKLSDDPLVRELLVAQRRRLAGVDLGWEVDRQLRTQLVFRPRLTDWARVSARLTTIYVDARNASLVAPRRSDSSLALLRNVDGQRDLLARLSVDPGRLSLSPETAGDARPWWARVIEPLALTYANGLTSRFNRGAVDPGFVYELGWGDRDDFLMIGSDSASNLSERARVDLRGGLRPVGWGSVTLGYERNQSQTLDHRSDREELHRVWPDLGVSATDVVMPGFLARAIERVTLRSGYRRVRRSLSIGAGTAQDRSRDDGETPLSVTVGLVRGLSLGYDGVRTRGGGVDPTGDTRRERNTHRIRAAAMLRAPLRALRGRGSPLRVSVDIRYVDELQCRTQHRERDCVPFIDQLEREVSLTVDSTARDAQLGVRLRYLDRRSFVGQGVGSTLVQLNVFGQFLLTPALLGSRQRG